MDAVDTNMSSFGVVSTVSPRTLKGVTQPELIQFEIEYPVYEEKIVEVNRSRDNARRIRPASIRNCFDPTLLQSLCILGQIDEATTLADGTDSSVKK